MKRTGPSTALLIAFGLLVSVASACSAGGPPGGGEDCATYHPDVDGDGLGDPRLPVTLCEEQPGYVTDGTDPEPDCPTNDTDDCGVCAGGNLDQDCAGQCFGTAAIDGCGVCAGGTTGVLPAPGEDLDGDGISDVCDACLGEGGPRFAVEYAGVPHASGVGGPYTFAAVLHASGEVLFTYGSIEPFAATPTVGLQAFAGDLGQDVPIDDTYLLDHPALVWTWDGAAASYLLEDTALLPHGALSAVGTELSLGDDAAVALDLPFDFPFYGQTADRLTVSSNGFLLLGEGALPGAANTELPTAAAGALIAPLWDALSPATGGSVRTWFAEDCAVDCAGVSGGFARLDSCDVCAGGTTGLEPDADLDCAGVCGGSASLDDCGICSGGTTGVEPSDPANCPPLPDFVPDQDFLHSTLSIDEVDVAEDSCLVAEGCVNGLGLRKVLRFGTRIANVGQADFHLGVPPGPGFHWDACHEHYHFEDYADYRLVDALDGSEAAVGHKNGWCLLDSGVFDAELAAAAGNDCDTYDCSNQGIGLGCYDVYGSGLSCQWIDITGVPDGAYQVQVTVNPDGGIEELDPTNNLVTATVEIVGNTVTLIGP